MRTASAYLSGCHLYYLFYYYHLLTFGSLQYLPPALTDDVTVQTGNDVTVSNVTIFTFNRPARSFVEFRHVWSSRDAAKRLTINFRFRSARPSGLLLNHRYDGDSDAMRQMVKLWQGMI